MKRNYLLAAVSIICWSSVAVITKLLLKSLNNIQVLWISSFFAALFLLILSVATGQIRLFKSLKPKDYLLLVLVNLPGTFLYYVFYYAGTDLMPASEAFIVNYLWPIMSVLFICILLKEKLTVKKIIAILLSFLGVGIVVGAKAIALNKDTLVGGLMCVLGAVSYGLFTALSKRFQYKKIPSMMVGFFVTFIITSIIVICSGEWFVPSFNQALGFAWNGMFTMALAGALWNTALEKGDSAKISNLAYITPFLSLVWTALILKEKITVNAVIGLAVIVLGILIQLKNKSKENTR